MLAALLARRWLVHRWSLSLWPIASSLLAHHGTHCWYFCWLAHCWLAPRLHVAGSLLALLHSSPLAHRAGSSLADRLLIAGTPLAHAFAVIAATVHTPAHRWHAARTLLVHIIGSSLAHRWLIAGASLVAHHWRIASPPLRTLITSSPHAQTPRTGSHRIKALCTHTLARRESASHWPIALAHRTGQSYWPIVLCALGTLGYGLS